MRSHFAQNFLGVIFTVKIVDARMGKGKTSAAINYMNAHPEKRYIYITPKIEETVRIKTSCPTLSFHEPCNAIAKFHFNKTEHLSELVERGVNISTTHQLFKIAEIDTINLICKKGYVVIIDEVMDIFETCRLSNYDINILLKSGTMKQITSINDNTSEIVLNDDSQYPRDSRFADIFRLARNHMLISTNAESIDRSVKYWTLQQGLFGGSNDVYVMTYLFQGSMMRAFFDIKGVKYSYIGVSQDINGRYIFTDEETKNNGGRFVKDKIHLVEDDKINDIGDNQYSLSESWFKNPRNKERVEQLKNNMYTFFYRRIPLPIKPQEKLWSGFKCAIKFLRGKGYSNRHIPINSCATNIYGNVKAFAYCANIFINPQIAKYVVDQGTTIDEDSYALSVMLQCIWRTAIRNDEEIWLYIPSRRMRELFVQWLNT